MCETLENLVRVRQVAPGVCASLRRLETIPVKKVS